MVRTICGLICTSLCVVELEEDDSVRSRTLRRRLGLWATVADSRRSKVSSEVSCTRLTASPSSLREKTDVGRCCKMRLFLRDDTLAGRPGSLKPSDGSRGLDSDAAYAMFSLDTSPWRMKYELLPLADRCSLDASTGKKGERGERGD